MRLSYALTLATIIFCSGDVQGRLASKISKHHGQQPRFLEQNTNCTIKDDCDDGNPLTQDSCDSLTNECVHVCDDLNECTREDFVDGICQYINENKDPYDCSNDDGSDCIPGLIDCSDNNLFTTDVCVPSVGCVHFQYLDYIGNLDGLRKELAKIEEEEAVFYEEKSGLTDSEAASVVNWLKLEVTQERTPFCWRRSYGRGVGTPMSYCPEGKERVGLFCVNPCQPGFTRKGLDCHQTCKDGWRDDGLFCRLAEYGRGAGYPWKFRDPPFDDRGMFERCERDHGGGNCEKRGLIVYPKCRPGYSPFGCCICRPNFESCEDEGYTAPRVDLSCAAKIEFGNPTPLICGNDFEQDGLLCYPKCYSGYNGVGPICWQICDDDQAGCIGGCARDARDCVFSLADQIISPALVAANLATLGATAIPSGAAESAITVAGHLYTFSTVVGEAMGWLANLLEQAETDTASDNPKNAKVVSITTGNTILDSAVSSTLFGAAAIMTRQFARDFEDMTSVPIMRTMVDHLAPNDLLHIQRVWADSQFMELATAEGWNLASVLLSSFGVLDPTGILNLVEAYAKPICEEIFDFPVCTRDNCMFAEEQAMREQYSTSCQDVQVYSSAEENCQAIVDPMSLDAGSTNPNHEKLFFALNPAGPYAVQSTSHSVELIVKDDTDQVIHTCQASITVLDNTPSAIECPPGIEIGNDPGLCSAKVDYSAPTVTNKCTETSVMSQTTGLPSGSVFEVGSTVNAFQATDSEGNTNNCSFIIGVFDNEVPIISCDDLLTAVPTDKGSCNATYKYEPPVATDNCGSSTVLSQSPNLDPFLFPLGTSTVEYTATDEAGKSASCSFVVEVWDDQVPVAECIPGDADGVFVIKGSDNCGDEKLKAFIIDSDSGTRFPSNDSGLDYFELGTTFSYNFANATESGALWDLQGAGIPRVFVEDEAGFISSSADCVHA